MQRDKLGQQDDAAFLTMAKILIISHGRVAMFHSISALAARLRDAGHSVIYASPDGVGPRASSAGLPHVQLSPSRSADAHHEIRNGVRDSKGDPQLSIQEILGVSELPEIVGQIDPDLLLIDIELHAHILRCLCLGVPIGLLSPFVTIVKRPGIPPLHSTTIPGRGWKGTKGYSEWLWARFRVRKTARRWLDRIRASGQDPMSLLRSLAMAEGVDFQNEITTWQWLIPFSYRHLPVLSLTASEFDFTPDRVSGTQYCGAMLERFRPGDELPHGDRSRLDALYERRLLGESDALIVCSLSTFFAVDPSFLARLGEALRNQPKWDLVLSLSGSHEIEGLDSLPDNVHVFPWIPQMEVLEKADCAVINAGTSVYECIRHGVPMVVYSLDFNDQNGTAARIAYHGLGVVGDKDGETPGTIRAHIESLLTDNGYRQRVEAMRQKLATYETEHRAVRAVESLIVPSESGTP